MSLSPRRRADRAYYEHVRDTIGWTEFARTNTQISGAAHKAEFMAGWSAQFDRVWRWRKNLPERHGQRCRIVARGKMNSALIEFEDGVRHIVSRNAIRKAPAEAEHAMPGLLAPPGA